MGAQYVLDGLVCMPAAVCCAECAAWGLPMGAAMIYALLSALAALIVIILRG